MRKAVLIVLALCAASAAADEAPVTMADLVDSLRRAEQITDFSEGGSDPARGLDESLDTIVRSGASALTVAEYVGQPATPGFLTLGHANRQDYEGLASDVDTIGLEAAVYTAIGVANNELYDALEAGLAMTTGSPDSAREAANRLLSPVAALESEIRQRALAENLAKLRCYEKKFGPRSPRLNIAEAIANYVAQWAPGFGPDDEGWPGHFEIVSSYDTAYLTAVDEEPELMSTAAFGVRYYLFGDGWGEKDGVAGLLQPGYLSLGVLVAPEHDGGLRWPWKGEERVGGFLAWGELKLAYVGGDEPRFMVSREFQAIPWLF